MRILIASYFGIPGRSGAWSTPVDLMGRDHELCYVLHRGRTGHYRLEGMDVYGQTLRLPAVSVPVFKRFIEGVNYRLYQQWLRDVLRKGTFDSLFCLDLVAARCAQRLGLRYVLRLHDYPADKLLYERVKANAVLVTAGDPEQKDAYYIRHGVDLQRLHYREHPRAESVVLVATLNRATLPLLFVEGVMKSKLRGYIYGDGELRREVVRACRNSDGKVIYMGAVDRLELDQVYGRHQIGVACLNRKGNLYVMKITEYLAAGVYPLVQDRIMQAKTIPHLVGVFSDANELAEKIDWVADNWGRLANARRQGRSYVEENYDTNKLKREFLELLETMRREGKLAIR